MTQQYRCIYEVMFIYPESKKSQLKIFRDKPDDIQSYLTLVAPERKYYDADNFNDIWQHCQGIFRNLEGHYLFHNIISIERIEVSDDKY